MSNSLSQKFDAIKLRLNELQQEDDKSAAEIKTDLFILVKVTGEFDEYLEAINDISFTHKRLIFNMGHIEKKRTFNSARENLLHIVENSQKEISAKEEHDAMMRAFHKVPLAQELEIMPDIELADLQSKLPPDSPGKIIIENEWQRRKLSKVPNPTPEPTSTSAHEITAEKKNWQHSPLYYIAVGVIIFILGVFLAYLVKKHFGIPL